MTTFIQAAHFHHGRRKTIRLVVWHDMESAEGHSTAEDVARWFAGPDAPDASAHVCADDDSVVECVLLTDTAWHCPNANADGVGYEQAGRRNQGNAGWRDPFSLATIRNLCRWHVAQPELAHIPDRFLSDAEVADGITPGHTTHEQCTRVFGTPGGHTDPGPDFPKDYVVQQLAAARGRSVPAVHPHVDRWLRFTNPRLSGQDVVNVQHALAVAGYNRSTPAAGVYDFDTAAGIAHFQRDHGIGERGVGPLTWRALRAVVHGA